MSTKNARRSPSKILDAIYHDQEDVIERLQTENEHLRTENSRLIRENFVLCEQNSRRTLQLALTGGLPKPGTQEHDWLGYKAPEDDAVPAAIVAGR